MTFLGTGDRGLSTLAEAAGEDAATLGVGLGVVAKGLKSAGGLASITEWCDGKGFAGAAAVVPGIIWSRVGNAVSWGCCC